MLFGGCLLLKKLIAHKGKIKFINYQKKYVLIVLLFTMYTCCSYFWAYKKEATLDTLPSMIRLLIVTIFLLNDNQNIVKVERYIKILLAAALYMCMKVLIHIPSIGIGFGSFADITSEYTGLQRNTVGQVAAMAVLLVFYLYIRHREKKVLVLFPFYIMTIFLSGSMKGFFIPFVGVMIYYVLILYQNGKIKKKNIITFVMIFMVICLALGTLLRLNQTILVRVTTMFGENATDGSSIVRRALAQKAIKLFTMKPVFGWGLDNMPYVNMNTFGLDVYQMKRHAHNNYLEILANLGIIGFVLYYAKYAFLIMNAIKEKNANRISKIFVLSVIITIMIFEYGIVSYHMDFYQYFILLLMCLVNSDNKNVNPNC